jgi:hypothetical protein
MQNRICSWIFLIETTKEDHWAMGYELSLKLKIVL